MAVDAHGTPLDVEAVQVVAARQRQDRPRRQRRRIAASPGAADDGRLAAGELDDAAAVDVEQDGDAAGGEHEDVGRLHARGHGGGQLAHDGVLLGDARQQRAADDDHHPERAEDEHRAQRVGRDALGARVRVVEHRHLVRDDGGEHAERP